jgi:hypothetical protein
MATTGAQILSTDLNTLRNKVSDVIGAGTGTYGYGQTVNSLTVISGQTVLKSHFDAIRYDIVNAYFHQNGLVPAATIAQIGDPISAGASDPFNGYNALADEIRSDRFDCDPGLLTITPKATTSYTSAWSSAAEHVITMTFANANDARHFWNSGSRLRITANRAFGSATAQNGAWTDLLSAAGPQTIGGRLPTPLAHTYMLTNTYQQLYTLAASTPYSNNEYKILGKCDVASNAAGTARIFDFKVLLSDNYTDPGAPAPGDSVDGTLTITIEELKASGTLVPANTAFSITSPAYTAAAISAS